jgi:CHAD domain-containing protein
MRFRRGETLSDAIDRVTSQQFDIALGIASAPPDDRALAVHSTRKAIKRLRSILRLVRGVIVRDRYEPDNQMLKLIAAELGNVRDAWVMAETLARLFAAGPETSQSLTPTLERLQARYDAETRSVLDNQAQMAAIIEQLENVRKRSPGWTKHAGTENLLPHAFSTIAPGIERCFTTGANEPSTCDIKWKR